MKQPSIIKGFIVKRNGFYLPEDAFYYCSECHGAIDELDKKCPYCKVEFKDHGSMFFQEK